MNQLTLKQFMLRVEVLKLYRQILRVTYRIDNKDYRKQLQHFIRSDFELNRNQTDESAIRMGIARGKLSLRELEQTVMLSN